MKRHTYHFPAPMLERLRSQAEREGTTISDVLRTAVRSYLEKHEPRATA